MKVAVIVLDTLRSDYFADHFEWLIEQGLYFSNAWTTSHWTVPAHASLFTGFYASELNVTHHSRVLDTPVDTIAEQYCDQGFKTRLFSDNYHVGPDFRFDRGFESVYTTWQDATADDADLQQHWIEWAREESSDWNLQSVLRHAVAAEYPTHSLLKAGLKLKFWNREEWGGVEIKEAIEETEWTDDEFVAANLMEAHLPYDAPDEYWAEDEISFDGYEATITGADVARKEVRAAYDAAVQFLSDTYQSIHDELLAADFDYVFTLSDHGELLGEHGAWGHQCSLYPEVARIPLTVTGRKVNDTDDTDEKVTLLDVHATAVNAGLSIDLSPRGNDIRSTQRGDLPALTEFHGLEKKFWQPLHEEGYDTEPWSQPRQGINLKDYYGFEDAEGEWHEFGDSPTDADSEELIAEIQETLEERYADEPAEEEVGEFVAERLEAIGYRA